MSKQDIKFMLKVATLLMKQKESDCGDVHTTHISVEINDHDVQ